MKHKLLSVFVFLFAATMFSYGQRTISGVVTSSKDKQPLIGATVIVEKTTIGTTTDIDGKYSLTVPNDAKNLIVSYTGMKSKTVLITGTTMDMALDENEKLLDDVVVTALGVKRDRKALGYATQQIGGSDVNEAKDANVINNLEGKVAGVQITGNGNIGGSSRIVIRGIKSLTGENQPLFVIDGVVIDNSNITSGNGAAGNLESGNLGYDYGNAASDINSDDIESINVLKGGAASALYGSRGANGVIVITTKKGAKHGKDKYKSPIGVTVSENVMFNKVAVLPQYQNSYGAGYGPNFQPDPVTGQLQLRMQDDGSWGPAIDGRLVRQYPSYDPYDPLYGKNSPYIAHPDNVKDFFQTGYISNTNVALDGANDNGAFRLSFSNLDQKGTVPNSSIDRNTLSFTGSYNFTDHLFASVGANYVHDENVGRPAVGYNSIFSNFTQWFERSIDVSDLKNYINPDGTQRTWNLNPYNNYLPYFWNNPYWQAYQNYENDHRDRIFGNAEVGYKILKWLTAKFRATTDFYNEVREERVAVGGPTAGGPGVGIPQYSIDKISVNENNYEGTLLAQSAFKHDFDLTALLGINRRENNVLNYYTSTQGGLNVPGWYNLANSTSTSLVEIDNIAHSRNNSIFGSASVGWKHMLYLDITMRNDWSSKLYSIQYPTSSYDSYFYPSVGGSWVFSELIKKNKVLSFGKLRASWAQIGNEPTATYATSNLQQPSTSFGSQYPAFYVPSTYNNPQLQAEKITTWEIGTDLSFFTDRVKIDAAYYHSLTTKNIFAIEQSGSTGINYRYTNAGDLQNQGVELASNFVIVKTKSSFSWSVGFNFSKNYNVVKDLYKDASGATVNSLSLATDGFGVMQLEAIPGMAYGQIVTTDFVYDKNGNKIVDLTGNYVKTAAPKPIGSILPDYVGGVSTTLAYKGLSLYVLIDYSKGGKIFSMTNMWGAYDGTLAITAANNIRVNGLVVPGVIEATDASGNPILDKNGNATSSGVKNNINISAIGFYQNGSGQSFSGPGSTNVYDATFVKLREIKLMYALPSKIFEKSPIRGISIGVVGRNLAILKKDIPNVDPESANSSGNIQGIEGGVKPTERSMGFNLSVKF